MKAPDLCSPSERISDYAKRRKELRGLSTDEIHGIDSQPNGGYELRLSDIEWQSKRIAELEAQAKASEWQPISTAPKDGLLLLLCTDGGIVFVGKLNKHLKLWVDDEGKERFRVVKYWMPLPLPPKRCEYCDGTGDVTGLDGEWRGYCVCDAGQALKTLLSAERCKCGYPMPCGLTVPVQFCRA